jgi:hypothetical protein
VRCNPAFARERMGIDNFTAPLRASSAPTQQAISKPASGTINPARPDHSSDARACCFEHPVFAAVPRQNGDP